MVGPGGEGEHLGIRENKNVCESAPPLSEFSSFHYSHVQLIVGHLCLAGAVIIESSFKSWLSQRGMKEEVIAVLKEEDVISSKVFKCLKEDHILRLLKNEVISVGQHSLIWRS